MTTGHPSQPAWRLLVALVLPFHAAADPALECSEATSQVEIGGCLADVAKRVDQAVATAYDLAMASTRELGAPSPLRRSRRAKSPGRRIATTIASMSGPLSAAGRSFAFGLGAPLTTQRSHCDGCRLIGVI